MKKILLVLPALFFVVHSAQAQTPKLVVIIVGDQIRADYLERFHQDLLPDGLRRFRDQGSYYLNARMDDAVTKTSPGHTLIGSGLYPRDSGIVNNDWYDVPSHHSVSAAELIAGGQHTQLRWFAGISFAERLHTTCPDCRMIGVSLKDRGALLLGGPDQDEAYWWDRDHHEFRSYHDSPSWLSEFNQHHHDLVSLEKRMETADADTVTELLTEEIVSHWQLGQKKGVTDVLTVSFSAVDLVGHRYGPDSPQIKSVFLNLDKQVSLLMKAVEKSVGKDVVWAFSSDHGVTPIPEVSSAQGLPAGRVPFARGALPHPEWIEATAAPFIYLTKPANAPMMKEELQKIKGVEAAYTTADIRARQTSDVIQRSFFSPKGDEPARSGDLWVVLKPKYIFSDSAGGTTHGQPTDDDQHVPMGFYGLGIPAQVFPEEESVARLAPTMLKLLGITTADLNVPLQFRKN